MPSDSSPGAPPAIRPEVYDDYDAFLRQAVREYYDLAWKDRKGSFIAFVLASGQLSGVAGEALKDGSGLKKAAVGAASLVALRLAMKYFLSGPLGLVLTVAAVGSAGAYLARNQREVSSKIPAYRERIEETRVRFEEVQGRYRAGNVDTAGRNLMVEGLRKQLLDRLDGRADTAV